MENNKEKDKLLKKNIRNFAIIAHIDHGKSTLADRIIEATSKKKHYKKENQILDSLAVEKERGITIKLNHTQLIYKSKIKNENFIFHLIDTPGHFDFNTEVTRSLRVCDGVILLIDCGKGIEAQTIQNAELAIKNNLKIIPVINKIDLEICNTSRLYNLSEKINLLLQKKKSNTLSISAKTGKNIELLLEKIIDVIPAPALPLSKELNCLVFDLMHDKYKGIIFFILVKSGSITKKKSISFFQTGIKCKVTDLGIKDPNEKKKNILKSGEIGWIVTNLQTRDNQKIFNLFKSSKELLITSSFSAQTNKKPHPTISTNKNNNLLVYSNIFPEDSEKYKNLKDTIWKINLTDPSFSMEEEFSHLFGLGLRCGFLGPLHLSITLDRIKKEYNMNIITTPATVSYKIKNKTNNEWLLINDANNLPTILERIKEPFVEFTIKTKLKKLSSIVNYVKKNGGKVIRTGIENESYSNLESTAVFLIPFSEIMGDFSSKIKSISEGNAILSYKNAGYKEAELIKLTFAINNEQIKELTNVVHKRKYLDYARQICEKIKNNLKQEGFDIKIYAIAGKRIVASERVKAWKKDVAGWLYGGDITRKMKLWKKQKRGKKKMMKLGKVKLPKSIFKKVFSSSFENK